VLTPDFVNHGIVRPVFGVECFHEKCNPAIVQMPHSDTLDMIRSVANSHVRMTIARDGWGYMRRFAFAVLLLVASQTMANIGDSRGKFVQRIDDDVWAVLHRTETPGATILVLRDGHRLYCHAYGFRALDGQLPASMDTHYEIGSITKQFTAAAILQLQDAGKLNIDAKVSTYLPDAPHAGQITLRQLLTHTSGLPDYIGLSSDEQATKSATFQQLMDVVADKPLDFRPGSRASYSNTGYILLGRIIELTSRESYRQYVRAHLLQPAGMTQTFTVADEPSLPTMAKGYRHANGKLEHGLTINDSYGWSAGNIVSTVGDLEKWNEALTSGKIVPMADYALMMTPQITTAGENSGYGFDLFIDTVNGQSRIGHTGGSYGFTAANFYFPEQKLRIIALTNNVDVPEPGEMLTNAIFNDLYPDLARAATRPAPHEDLAVTSKVKTAFEHLQKGTDDASLFGASLNAKMKTSLAKHMADEYGPYGAPTAFVFRGRRSDGGKNWSDYLIEFGPGSTLKFSVGLDAEAKVISLGFNTF
jgi:CubicO group peptidase (beta-lactamase class C family)